MTTNPESRTEQALSAKIQQLPASAGCQLNNSALTLQVLLTSRTARVYRVHQ